MATTSGRRHLLRRGFLDLELHWEITVGNGSGKPHGERSLRIPRDLLLPPSSVVAKTQMRKIGQKYNPDKVELDALTIFPPYNSRGKVVVHPACIYVTLSKQIFDNLPRLAKAYITPLI
ncbi:MAG: hypothetical protein AAGN35_05450 [Bacteroidota bacterium]